MVNKHTNKYMIKASDFRQKEVINICDGKRMGYVCDVDIDMTKGIINSIVVPSGGKILGIFGRDEDIVIPWNKVKTVGDDIILVEYHGQGVKDFS